MKKLFEFTVNFHYICRMIQELLEERDHLFEIATVLYGDMFVTDESFWGSPTELQLQRVYDRLDLFGQCAVQNLCAESL